MKISLQNLEVQTAKKLHERHFPRGLRLTHESPVPSDETRTARVRALVAPSQVSSGRPGGGSSPGAGAQGQWFRCQALLRRLAARPRPGQARPQCLQTPGTQTSLLLTATWPAGILSLKDSQVRRADRVESPSASLCGACLTLRRGPCWVVSRASSLWPLRRAPPTIQPFLPVSALPRALTPLVTN